MHLSPLPFFSAASARRRETMGMPDLSRYVSSPRDDSGDEEAPETQPFELRSLGFGSPLGSGPQMCAGTKYWLYDDGDGEV